MLRLLEPDSPEAWYTARQLVEAYATSIGIDLSFQGFAHELETLSHEYGAPSGCFMLAWWEGKAVGCGGVRRFSHGTCEMKRLYVDPDFRRKGIGRAIAQTLIERARELGYATMVLDTLSTMDAALHVYRTLGFVETAPYRHNPLPGATYMRLAL